MRMGSTIPLCYVICFVLSGTVKTTTARNTFATEFTTVPMTTTTGVIYDTMCDVYLGMNPCQNNGYCEPDFSYRKQLCRCRTNFYGQLCENTGTDLRSNCLRERVLFDFVEEVVTGHRQLSSMSTADKNFIKNALKRFGGSLLRRAECLSSGDYARKQCDFDVTNRDDNLTGDCYCVDSYGYRLRDCEDGEKIIPKKNLSVFGFLNLTGDSKFKCCSRNCSYIKEIIDDTFTVYENFTSIYSENKKMMTEQKRQMEKMLSDLLSNATNFISLTCQQQNAPTDDASYVTTDGKDPCKNLQCPDGVACKKTVFPCLVQPCPIEGSCKGATYNSLIPEDPCQKLNCSFGSVCVPLTINCITTPCPVAASCKTLCEIMDSKKNNIQVLFEKMVNSTLLAIDVVNGLMDSIMAVLPGQLPTIKNEYMKRYSSLCESGKALNCSSEKELNLLPVHIMENITEFLADAILTSDFKDELRGKIMRSNTTLDRSLYMIGDIEKYCGVLDTFQMTQSSPVSCKDIAIMLRNFVRGMRQPWVGLMEIPFLNKDIILEPLRYRAMKIKMQIDTSCAGLEHCPANLMMQASDCVEECSNHSTCPGAKLCCPDRCGHVCVDPEVTLDEKPCRGLTPLPNVSCGTVSSGCPMSHYCHVAKNLSFAVCCPRMSDSGHPKYISKDGTDPCKKLLCPADTGCNKKTYPCVVPPCPIEGSCPGGRIVSHTNEDPCKMLQCPHGQICKRNKAMCETVSCPVSAYCDELPKVEEPCHGKRQLQTIYCGRGQPRCPDSYYCDIAPDDTFAVCCYNSTDNADNPKYISMNGADPCKKLLCPADTGCKKKTYPCLVSPCPVEGSCPGGRIEGQTGEEACKMLQCPHGQICKYNKVICITEPCLVSAYCEDTFPVEKRCHGKRPLKDASCGKHQPKCPKSHYCHVARDNSFAVCCYNSTDDDYCPSVKPGQMGICVEMCSSHANCSGSQLCCSNGCGHQCMDPAVPRCASLNKTISGICSKVFTFMDSRGSFANQCRVYQDGFTCVQSVHRDCPPNVIRATLADYLNNRRIPFVDSRCATPKPLVFDNACTDKDVQRLVAKYYCSPDLENFQQTNSCKNLEMISNCFYLKSIAFGMGCLREDISRSIKHNATNIIGTAVPKDLCKDKNRNCSAAQEKNCGDVCADKKCFRFPSAKCKVDPCTCKSFFEEPYHKGRVNCAEVQTKCRLDRAKKWKQKLKDQSLNASSIFVPTCESDGTYARQCNDATGRCWCNNAAGQKVPESDQSSAALDVKCSKNKPTIQMNITVIFKVPFSKIKGKTEKFKLKLIITLNRMGVESIHIKNIEFYEGSIKAVIQLEKEEDDIIDLEAISDNLKNQVENGELKVDMDDEVLTAATDTFDVEREFLTEKPPTIVTEKDDSDNEKIIIIASVVGGIFLLVTIIVIVCIVKNRRTSSSKNIKEANYDEPAYIPSPSPTYAKPYMAAPHGGIPLNQPSIHKESPLSYENKAYTTFQ